MQVVTHNILSQFTSRQLKITTGQKSKSAEKLGSGYRINRSADDAAGLKISEKMRYQLRGLKKGSTNAQEGISMLQVADGALNEVHAMLQRMNELVIQAANDTNEGIDREAIQDEIAEIILEIDRVGNDTEYNKQPIFKGGETTLLDGNGNSIDVSDLKISDLQLANTTLRNDPFTAGSGGGQLNLAVSTKDGIAANPVTWDLIYGDGGTSNTTMRVHYLADDGVTEMTAYKDLNTMQIKDYNYDAVSNTYERTFVYDTGNGVSFDIKQTIAIDPTPGENAAQEMYYNMSYEIVNTGTKEASIDFMFNADSAYNNNDRCETYFIGGQEVEKHSVYVQDTTQGMGQKFEQQSPNNVYSKDELANDAALPDVFTVGGFSIIDTDNALPFSVSVNWKGSGNEEPDAVSIGNYGSSTGDWNYYDNLGNMLGGQTDGSDLAFSLIWNRDLEKYDPNDPTSADAAKTTISFRYGVVGTKDDPNIPSTVEPAKGEKVHTEKYNLWIQTSSEIDDGLFITIGEMNTGILGVRGIKVDNFTHATEAIETVAKAINIISSQRSNMGALSNRLEHIVAVDDNTAENTQAAESRIRDTDMAKEMLQLSKHSILEQAGQSVMAQANQMPQGILSLLQ